MSSVMLEFELNEDDRKQIRNLKKQLRKNFNTKEEKDSTFNNYFEKVQAIYSHAHERALMYYEKNQDKILPQLKKECKNYAIIMGALDKSVEDIKIHQSTETNELKISFMTEINSYLEILKKNIPKDYEEIISFIDYAIEHRVELYEEEREAIKEGKKKSIMPNSRLPKHYP